MKTGASLNRGNSKQDYPTPWEFIKAVESRFGKLTTDLAARDDNKKAPRFISETENSLRLSWPIGGICWLNPPFGNIAPWAEKCATESSRGVKILFLTPASVGANWFANYVHPYALVLALGNRITFEGATDPYPKDCILSAFGFGAAGFEVWKWKTTKEVA